MKIGVGRLVVAIVLVVAGAACWAEARLARRVAGAHQRLATLHYDADDGVEEAMTPIDRLPWPMGSLEDEVRAHRARVLYWRSREDPSVVSGSAAPPLPGTMGGKTPGDENTSDAEQMFVATNIAFRAAQKQLTDRTAAVERLDAIIEAYAEVLRADAGNVDAAFNYEFVARYRDTVARGRGPIPQKIQKPADEEAGITLDLPAGPTIHGRPGAPPPELPGDEFKTLVPIESEEQQKPGEGTSRRKG